MSDHQVVWFDMPVTDLDRAVRFYSAVIGAPLNRQDYDGHKFATFPHAGEHAVSGCLTPNLDGKPSAQGVLVYINCAGRLDAAIDAVAPNGGKVLQAKHPIGPYGFRAVVLDSKGNRIALHSK